MSGPADNWLPRLAGKFIVFDGPDGSGKSTQFRRFHRHAVDAGLAVCEVREPGGTAIGEAIRRVLLDPDTREEVDLRCEMLLFMASRAQLAAQRIAPALARGELVLADRFISSTLAYQGAAGGLPTEDILAVGRIALRQCWPDLTVIFDVDEATALSRMSPLLRPPEFAGDRDRMEQKGGAYHRKVRQGYLEQAARNPERYLVLDAGVDADRVFERLLAGLGQRWR